jgi:hypothetical protein
VEVHCAVMVAVVFTFAMMKDDVEPKFMTVVETLQLASSVTETVKFSVFHQLAPVVTVQFSATEYVVGVPSGLTRAAPLEL